MPGSGFEFLFQLRGQLFQVNLRQQFLDVFRADTGIEIIFVFFAHIGIVLIRQHLLFLQRGATGVYHDILGEIQHLLQLAGGHIQDKSHARRNALEIPNVRYRRCQFDMTHALTAHFRAGNFYATAFTHLAFVADAFVATAMALPVFGRPENLLAEQAVPFRFEGAIVDGFRLQHLAVGPAANLLRRGQPNTNGIKYIELHHSNTASPYIVISSSE